MRYAIVENGKVVNVTKSNSALAANWIQSDTAVIGDSHDGSVFSSPTDSFDGRKEALISRAKDEKQTSFYSNVAIAFPVTQKEIHFRNEIDRANISDKTMQAFINVSLGNGSAAMKFTPVDGTPVTMTSQELLTAFAGLATAKDALFYAYNSVIEDLEAATDDSGLDSAETTLNAL